MKNFILLFLLLNSINILAADVCVISNNIAYLDRVKVSCSDHELKQSKSQNKLADFIADRLSEGYIIQDLRKNASDVWTQYILIRE